MDKHEFSNESKKVITRFNVKSWRQAFEFIVDQAIAGKAQPQPMERYYLRHLGFNGSDQTANKTIVELNARFAKHESLIKERKPRQPKPKIDQPAKNKETEALQLLCQKTWSTYADCYQRMYQTEPVRNARQYAAIKNICQRLGAEAPKVVEFYFTHHDPFYLKSLHSLPLLQRDCESLATQAARGVAITNKIAHDVSRKKEGEDVINRILERVNKL